MKLAGLALTSSVLGTALGILGVSFNGLIFAEGTSSADLLGFAPMMFAGGLLVCGFIYVPGLYWLRKRKSRRTTPSPLPAWPRCSSPWPLPPAGSPRGARRK